MKYNRPKTSVLGLNMQAMKQKISAEVGRINTPLMEPDKHWKMKKCQNL